MAESPFVVEVFDKAFRRAGFVGNPASLTVTLRHNAAGSAVLVVDADHKRAPDLGRTGARVRISYRGRVVLTGMSRLTAASGPFGASTASFTIEDDFRKLANTLGWQNPTAAIGNQGLDNTAYKTYAGPAETVVKAVARDNLVTRLGFPIEIVADQGRGAAITAAFRMHPLTDQLFPAVDTAGIGVTLRQKASGVGWVLDCYTPRVYPRELTERSGDIADWSWSAAAPTATRVIVAAQGEAAARKFVRVTDAAAEAAWGDVIEVARDARDTDDDPTLLERGQETLTEAAAKYGLAVTLAESAGLRYGRAADSGPGDAGLAVGDRVAMRVGQIDHVTSLSPGYVINDLLRSVTLTWTRGEGLQVTPTVGEKSDDPSTQLARAIGVLARFARQMKTTQ